MHWENESQSKKNYKSLTLNKLSGLLYKNKLILSKIQNLRLNLVNPVGIALKERVFASVFDMKAGQRAMSKYESKIMIIVDWEKKGNQYDADDEDDDMNQLVKYARDKKKLIVKSKALHALSGTLMYN